MLYIKCMIVLPILNQVSHILYFRIKTALCNHDLNRQSVCLSVPLHEYKEEQDNLTVIVENGEDRDGKVRIVCSTFDHC